MAGYIKNSSGGYSVDYEDERFQEIEDEKVNKETELNDTYDNIIDNSDKHFQDQIDATKDYAEEQKKLQQEQTDFAIDLIEQQKDKAEKDYVKEEKGAYVDYMKKTKSNAQNMANSGLNNTGYSESSIVSMYNQYQNRVGTAKESLSNAILNYNNGIQQAILANNEKLAEIAFNALQTENQLNQQAFEYKNSMILQKEQALQELNDRYYARYQNVLAQINTEIELQMELDRIDREYEMWLKEFNEQHEQWKKEYETSKQQWEKEFALQERQINAAIATENAQASYYRAQASSLNSSNNPYGNNEDVNANAISSKDFANMKSSIRDLKAIKSNSSAYSKAQQNLTRWIDIINEKYDRKEISKAQGEALLSMIYSS
ncbi:MAG: hypothetical protein IJ272_04680 [Clostridia bacterium]|nr:hypothetical protein [Clostridia bacterium]